MGAEPSDVDLGETTPLSLEALAGQEPRSRYAVPLPTLLAGAVVPVAERVEIQPEPPVPVSDASSLPLASDVGE